MKIPYSGSKVTVTGAKRRPQTFKIAQTKEMFRLMSRGVYNDQILAVIRELCCNAYDAHVSAGKRDVPFELHLPSKFEPWFEVKDYGTGLSHDDVMALYCTYGASSKTDDNTQVGAFGIGSKSPFAYADGFTVTSRFNGVVRHYDCHVTETGTPEVVMLSEAKDPKAKNGLTVNFAVRHDDCWEFSNKAVIALEFFNPLPENNIEVDVETQDYVIRTARWGLRANAQTQQTSRIRAIQGLVAYAIGSIDNSRMTPIQRKIADMPLDLFFDLGELTPAASRETLSNDDHTIENLLAAFDRVAVEVIDEVKAKLALCSQPWEARILLNNMIVGPMAKLVVDALDEGKFFGAYKNYTLNGRDIAVNEFDYAAMVLHKFSSSYGVLPKQRYIFHRDRATYMDNVGKMIASGKVKKDSYTTPIECDADVVFVIDDGTKGAHRYIGGLLNHPINEHKQENGARMYGHAYFMQQRPDTINVVFRQEVANLMEAAGNPPSFTVEELKALYAHLDKKDPNAPVYEERKVLRLQQKRSSHYGFQNFWEKADHKNLPDGTKFYVAVEKLKPVNAKFFNGREMFDFIEKVQESGAFGIDSDTVIYGLQKNSPRRKKAEWVELFDYIFSSLPSIMTVQKEAELSLLVSEFDADFDWWLRKIVDNPEWLDSESEFLKFAQSWGEASKHAKKKGNRELLEVLERMETWEKYKLTATVNYTSLWQGMLEIYPMLKVADTSRYIYEHEDVLTNYIKLIDSIRRQEAFEATRLRSIRLEDEP